MHILGIDIGGTGIKAGIVDTSQGTLITERLRLLTPKPATPENIAQTLKQVVKHFDWHGEVGIGFPAAIQHGIARTAANIDQSFINFPIAHYFSEAIGCPVAIANDADVAGIAEMRFGAGQQYQQNVVLIVTIGTGLGTALFTNGILLPNTELGHIYLKNGAEAEKFASESVRVQNKMPWFKWANRLNRYLTTMEQLFWPDLIILGGGASHNLHKFEHHLTTRAPTLAATFLNQAGIVGAALFAESPLSGSLVPPSSA